MDRYSRSMLVLKTEKAKRAAAGYGSGVGSPRVVSGDEPATCSPTGAAGFSSSGCIYSADSLLFTRGREDRGADMREFSVQFPNRRARGRIRRLRVKSLEKIKT